jgi:hypothetical protein
MPSSLDMHGGCKSDLTSDDDVHPRKEWLPAFEKMGGGYSQSAPVKASSPRLTP